MNVCFGIIDDIFTAWPAVTVLDPEIGGYRIPQEYPLGGQHLSSPIWHEFCVKTAGVIPEDMGETVAEGVEGF